MIGKRMLQHRREHVVACQKKLDFPRFLELLRKSLMLSRMEVCEILGISQTRLFFLEKGIYVRAPKKELLGLIANFYGVSYSMLVKKSKIFLEQKKNRPQRYGRAWRDFGALNFDLMLRK